MNNLVVVMPPGLLPGIIKIQCLSAPSEIIVNASIFNSFYFFNFLLPCKGYLQ